MRDDVGMTPSFRLSAWSVILLVAAGCTQQPTATSGPINPTDSRVSASTTTRQADPTSTSAGPAASPSETKDPQAPTYTARDTLELHQRPLDLDYLSDEECPVTEPSNSVESVALTYGAGPLYAVLGTPDGKLSLSGDDLTFEGWTIFKVLWVVAPEYGGPAVVRGRQLNGGSALMFSPNEANPTGKQLTAIVFSPGSPLADQSARFGPGGMMIRMPGCFAMQVDGVGFQYSIVFEVEP